VPIELAWTDALLSLGVGIGLAAAAGLRVFLPLLVLGIAARAGWVPLGGEFAWLTSEPGLVALGIATLIEVGGYYSPIVDNLLDVIAGPLAIMAGILLTAAVTADLPPAVRWASAVVAGGGTAGIVQALTSLTRLQSTATTGGLANPLLATFELAGSFIAAVLAILVPLAAILLVAIAVVLIRRVGRRLRRTS
jgi:hypothetical protein